MSEISVRQDAADGVIRCTFHGFFTAADMAAFRADLFRVCAAARRASFRLLMLLDAAAGVVQSPEIVAEIAAIVRRVRGPHDRVAVVVGSSLMKLQAQRIIHVEQVRAFSLRDEAEAWLRTAARDG